MGTTLTVLCQGHRRSTTQGERKRRSGIRGEIENLQRCFKDTGEDERQDVRDIRDGVELPSASRAILVLVGGAGGVFVMMDNAEKERHAQIEQTDDDRGDARLHH